MRTIRKILVAVKEPTAATLPAVDKAAALARAFGASIELYHSITEKVLADPFFQYVHYTEDFERETEQRYKLGLESLVAKLRKQGLKARASVDWDYPTHEALVRQARRDDIDLIVAECHAGARKAAPWLLHVTDWELLRMSPVPVLLVKNQNAWNNPVVLAALDPSHSQAKRSALDAEILKISSLFTDTFDGSLEVMHAYTPIPPGMLMGMGASGTMPSQVAAESERRAKKRLQETLKAFGQTRMPRHVVPGKAAETIPQIARETNCSILVMGAVSRSGLKRVFIGNTAERVLDTLACDVLVVKPPSFKSRISLRPSGVRYVGMAQGHTPR